MFIKDLDIGEVWANYTKSYITSSLGEACKNEFTTWNSAYLQRTSTATDAEPDENDLVEQTVSNPHYNLARYYI